MGGPVSEGTPGHLVLSRGPFYWPWDAKPSDPWKGGNPSARGKSVSSALR